MEKLGTGAVLFDSSLWAADNLNFICTWRKGTPPPHYVIVSFSNNNYIAVKRFLTYKQICTI